jgi:hypothetical protein
MMKGSVATVGENKLGVPGGQGAGCRSSETVRVDDGWQAADGNGRTP